MPKTKTQSKLPLEFYRPDFQMFTVMHVVKNAKTSHADKYPLNADTGKIMKWKKNPHFLTLNDAERYLNKLRKTSPDQHFEIGMLVQSPYVLLDLDGIDKEVEDLKNGVASQRIKDLIKLTKNCYIEISQSGHGLHFIFEGKKTTTISHTTNYELYDNNRWLALTGNYLHMPSQLPQLSQDDMKQLEQYLFKDELKKKAEMSQNTSKSAVKGNNLELDQIISKIKNSKQADNFNQLWKNEDGENPSSGDQALVNILVWWTNHDLTKADQLFRKSKRMRDKWDEVHATDGRTYGQLTLENADSTVSGGYTGKRQQVEADKVEVKSMADLIKNLQAERSAWDLNHTNDKGNVANIDNIDIIQILENNVPLAVLYSYPSERDDAPLFYYDFDQGIYANADVVFERLILAVAPERTSKDARKNIISTLRAKPSNKIIEHQLTTVTDTEHRFFAVGNGIFDTKKKELLPFDHTKWFFTSKIATNYNPNTTVEPIFNGWSWSKSLDAIAGGQEDKKKLLWQTCKASLLGYWWLRQAVILIDKGSGQTGKSTFEQALINTKGKENTTSLRLAEMTDEQKLLDAVNVSLIIGDDNDVHQPISNYANINPLISGEYVRVKKLYEKSRMVQIHAFILQSANGLPPLKNSTDAVFKRFVVIMFNTQHNAKNPADFAVKNDYINRKEFKEWLLNYVLNHVEVGVSLTDTKESHELLNESKLENDTIDNFVNNWMPTLSSTKIPASWLYSLYATACTIDSQTPESKRAFTRKICDNKKFSQNWKKVHSVRITPEEDFTFDDAKNLQKLSSSVKWGHHVQSFFPVTRHTISDGDNSHRESVSFDEITADDFKTTLQSFHGVSFVKKQ